MDTSGRPAPESWGPPVVVETHTALVFLCGDEAHKVRKPIDLGFLDNRTVEARGEQSRREVELPAALADARLALELADRAVDSLLRGRVRLVLVGGVSGSGKSTLAGPLAQALGAELLRSDVVRQQLRQVRRSGVGAAAGRAGGAADRGAGSAADGYSDAAVGAVYAEMLERAAVLLARGRSVVLDATWLDPRRRAEAKTVAADAHAELVEISCTAPRDDLARRITERARRGTDPSEATVEVLDAQLAEAAPWPDAGAVDTAELDVRDAEAVHAWAERELGPLPWA